MTTHEKRAYHQPGVLRVLQSREQVEAYYDKIAKVYDLLSERSEQPIRDAAIEMLAIEPGERALEIGFGTGHCLVTLARAVGPAGKVFGVDLSGEMVQQTRGLLNSEGVSGRVQIRQDDAVHLPYEPGSMDAVLMTFTLELFDTPEIPIVLDQIRQVLRRGGRIAVASVSRRRSDDVMTEIFEWTHRHLPNLLDCRPIFVRQALEDAGFQVREEKLEHMWVPVEVILAVKP